MFDIDEVDDFIASNRLTHSRRPENGLRVYFPKNIVAERVANEFGSAILDEIVIYENRQGTMRYAEINWQGATMIDEHCDSWRVGAYESIEAAFARMGHDISKRGGTNA